MFGVFGRTVKLVSICLVGVCRMALRWLARIARSSPIRKSFEYKLGPRELGLFIGSVLYDNCELERFGCS